MPGTRMRFLKRETFGGLSWYDWRLNVLPPPGQVMATCSALLLPGAMLRLPLPRFNLRPAPRPLASCVEAAEH